VRNFLRGETLSATACRNIGHFLCGVERVKRCVYVHLRCVVNNLKRIREMSTLPPPLEKFLRTPMTMRIIYCVW